MISLFDYMQIFRPAPGRHIIDIPCEVVEDDSHKKPFDVEATEVYLTQYLEVPAERNPLLLYDFRPRITFTKVVKEVCKCTVTLLLLTGAWIEINTAHDDIMRTVRNCRSARARIGRPVRRSSETADFYLNRINIDYQ